MINGMMLAHSRNRVTTGAVQPCHPCMEKQRGRYPDGKTRTAGIEIGGAGISEWQKTNNVVLQMQKEFKNWVAAYSAEAQKRADSGTFGGLCKKGGSLQECLTPSEREANKWIQVDWLNFVMEWNDLLKEATTGVPWGDDPKLREAQKKLMNLRARFEELANYKFLPIPAWSPDRGFFEAVKESTGVDIPAGIGNAGLIAAGVGGLVLLVSLLKK